MKQVRRLVRLLGVGLSLAAWGAAPGAADALAQELEDVVYLKDGGVMRGIIVEQIPNESILLRTRDGNQFRFQMSQIAKMTREALVPAPAPQPAPSAVSQPATGLASASLQPAQQQPVLNGTKSPGAALFLSFLIPGAGQVYNGQAGKGLLHFALGGVATWVALNGFASEDCAGGTYTYWDTWSESYTTGWFEGGECTWGFAGLGAALGVHIWSMVDAASSARGINRRARMVSLRVEPSIAARGARVRVSISTPALLR
jgi:hypothetical protein